MTQAQKAAICQRRDVYRNLDLVDKLSLHVAEMARQDGIRIVGHGWDDFINKMQSR